MPCLLTVILQSTENSGESHHFGGFHNSKPQDRYHLGSDSKASTVRCRNASMHKKLLSYSKDLAKFNQNSEEDFSGEMPSNDQCETCLNISL